MNTAPPKSIPLTRPCFPEAMRQAILRDLDRVLSSGRLMMGPYQEKLEAAFRELTETAHAVSLNAATTGLQIALRHCGAKDREVLVPAASFVTDVSACLFEGATPVLVDIDPETLALDLDDLERKVSPRTVAIIWVHLTGFIAANHDAIRNFARDRGLFLIEDASHAHGASVDGRPAGSLGDVGIFSFYPTKIMTSGTGGMLVTEDAELARFAREMRLFGKESESGEIVHLGNDWFLDEIRACVAAHQVAGLADQLARRRAAATYYWRRFANRPGLRVLSPADAHAPAWYQYPVFLDAAFDHDRIVAALKAENIAAKRIYKPVHREAVFRGFDTGTLGAAETMLERSLCLPMFGDITEQETAAVADALLRAIAAQGAR